MLTSYELEQIRKELDAIESVVWDYDEDITNLFSATRDLYDNTERYLDGGLCSEASFVHPITTLKVSIGCINNMIKIHKVLSCIERQSTNE